MSEREREKGREGERYREREGDTESERDSPFSCLQIYLPTGATGRCSNTGVCAGKEEDRERGRERGREVECLRNGRGIGDQENSGKEIQRGKRWGTVERKGRGAKKKANKKDVIGGHYLKNLLNSNWLK